MEGPDVDRSKEPAGPDQATNTDSTGSSTSNGHNRRRSNERSNMRNGNRERNNDTTDREQDSQAPGDQRDAQEKIGEDMATPTPTPGPTGTGTGEPAVVTEEPQQMSQHERGKSIASNTAGPATSAAVSNTLAFRSDSEVNASVSTTTKEVTTESTTPIASRVSKTRSTRQHPFRQNTNNNNNINNNQQTSSNGITTIHEMRRRVSLMLEHISRLQFEMAMTETPALANTTRPNTSATMETTTHSAKGSSPSKGQRLVKSLLPTGPSLLDTPMTATNTGKGMGEAAANANTNTNTNDEPRTPARGPTTNVIMSDGDSSPLSSPAASPMGSFSILDGPIMGTTSQSNSNSNSNSISHEQEKWEQEVREQKEKGFGELSSVEMMDVLTRNLLRWQQEFGKTDK